MKVVKKSKLKKSSILIHSNTFFEVQKRKPKHVSWFILLKDIRFIYITLILFRKFGNKLRSIERKWNISISLKLFLMMLYGYVQSCTQNCTSLRANYRTILKNKISPHNFIADHTYDVMLSSITCFWTFLNKCSFERDLIMYVFEKKKRWPNYVPNIKHMAPSFYMFE